MTMLAQRTRFPRWASRALAVGGFVLAATLVYADCRIAANARDSTQKPVAAEFTGELDGGVPVYRLPSITVSASRGIFALETPQKKRDAAVDGTHRAQVVRSRSSS